MFDNRSWTKNKRLLSTCRFEALHLLSCPPVCPHPCHFFSLSVCLLDGPLCHSATNGHCWASHFLNDTLLRSIQLPCSYTLTLLPLFSFTPPVSTTSSHAGHSGLPPSCKRKAVSCQFSLNIFHQHASRWGNLILLDTITPYHWLKGRLTAYNWSIFLLIAAPSPAGRSFIIHHSFRSSSSSP